MPQTITNFDGIQEAYESLPYIDQHGQWAIAAALIEIARQLKRIADHAESDALRADLRGDREG